MEGSADSALDRKLGYLVFRLSLGINIFVHGAGRIFGAGVAAFAAKTSEGFSQTFLPHRLVYAFLIAVPIAELILGVLLTLGLFLRWALLLGGLLIVALIFGTSLQAEWSTVGTQMIYAIVYYLLLINRRDDFCSLDTLIHAQRG